MNIWTLGLIWIQPAWRFVDILKNMTLNKTNRWQKSRKITKHAKSLFKWLFAILTHSLRKQVDISLTILKKCQSLFLEKPENAKHYPVW